MFHGLPVVHRVCSERLQIFGRSEAGSAHRMDCAVRVIGCGAREKTRAGYVGPVFLAPIKGEAAFCPDFSFGSVICCLDILY